jgi:hypothetical protein
MKKFLLSATAAAILTGWAGMAAANVNLDTGVGLSTYASELITNNVTSLNGAALDVDHRLGFGVSNGQTRYLRYTLTNGVFATPVSIPDLTFPGDVTVAQGGGAGQNFVIFQITAIGDLLETQAVTFLLGGGVGVTVTNKSSGVSMNYQLYETAADAAAGGAAGLLYSRSNTVAGIGSGLTFTTTPNTTTAEVADEYKKFNNGVGPTLAKIGNLTHVPTAGVLRPADGNQVQITDLVAAGTKVVITTDSNWGPVTNVGDVYISTDAACGGVALAAASRTANTTDIIVNVGTSPGLGICYQANGTTPIEAQNFTIVADVVPAPNTDTSDRGPIALGNFNRNGTVLKAAFAETATSGTGYSTSANMTNLGASPAPYTVRCLTNTGSVAGTPGTIPAGTAVRYGVNSTLGCPSGGTLRGIELTFAVPEGRVIGSVVRQNLTTGQASFDNMIGSK